MHPFEVEIDQLKLRGWRRPGSGPRCLAIHGWLDNAGTFSRLVEHLPDWDFLALDLPGHGRSQSLPAPGFYHFIDGVHWVSQLLLHWGADRPLVLLGHSLGGGLASMAAAVCPKQVACLVELQARFPGERVWMFSHEAVILAFRYVLEGLDAARVVALQKEEPVANCSMTRYRNHDGALTLVARDDVSALLGSGDAHVTREPGHARDRADESPSTRTSGGQA